MVDATILSAAYSTQYRNRTRDPDRYQIRKGQQRYLRMQTHAGVDSKTQRVHNCAADARAGSLLMNIGGTSDRP